jgi:toxin-antitoxin system PIN domain toxin
VKVVDVNVLLGAINPSNAHHAQLSAWWAAALHGSEPVGLAWIVILGFLRISTNKKFYPQPLAVADGLEQVGLWLSAPNVQLVQEPNGHWQIFADLLRQVGTGGNLTTDVHLAALAIERGATLVSCDTDFARFKRLKWENPAAVP